MSVVLVLSEPSGHMKELIIFHSLYSVSCTSLNKTGLGPQYNRARRPSMIGDETMCHDTNIKTQSSLDDYVSCRSQITDLMYTKLYS